MNGITLVEVSNLVESLKQMQMVDPGDHLVLLYRDENIERIVAAFIAASLMRNERCIYIKGDSDTDQMLLFLSELVDTEQAIADKQLYILDKSDAYLINGAFVADKIIELLKSEAMNALRDGYLGLSVTGELSWLPDYAKNREMIIEYEWKLNERIFCDYKVTALCRYNLDKFSPKMIKSIIELHPFIMYGGVINENPFYVEPEGYRYNKIEEYEVNAWLENINNFTKTKSKFLSDIEKKDREYSELFNKIQDGIFLSEVDSVENDIVIRNINKAAMELSGYTKEELLGKSISILDRTPDLKDMVSKLPGGFEKTFESELVHRDGTKRAVEINTKLYREGDKKFVLTVARDISMRKKYIEDILATVTNFLEIHDDYTKGHSENVAMLARKTAVAMGASLKVVNEAYLTGLVHDIGKMLISSKILNKPGKLDRNEYEMIMNHPVWAYDAIIKNDELIDIAKNARHHHERWDGCGYPDGLREKEIPIVSQILIVVDAYDAMTSERSYRKAMSTEEAICEIASCKGTQFPPEIADIFIEKVLK